jgi:predicted MFS family arabinose efflux permease
MLLLTVAVTAAAYARTGVSPLQETMRAVLALSDNQMALLQGPAMSLPLVVAAIPLGLLIDRYSRVRLVFAFTVVDAVGSVLTGLASSFRFLLVGRCLVGFAALAINPVALSLLADFYPPAQRGRATMVIAIGQVGGMSAAFALGGALLAAAGSAPNGWRWTMLWLTVPLALVIFAMVAMREPPRTGLAIENPSLRQAWAELWVYRATIAPVLVGAILAEIALGAPLIWAAPALSRSFGLAPDRIGAIMGMGLMVSGILGPIAGGTLADLCQRTGGSRRTMFGLSGLALVSTPAGLFAVMPGVASASVLLVMFLTIVSAMCVMGTTLFTVVIPNELRGVCMAAFAALCVVCAIGLAPLTVSVLSGAIGGPAMIGKALALVGVTTSVLAAATFAVGGRYFPRTVAKLIPS